MNLIRKKIEIDFPLDYYYLDRGGNKLVILLHGFAQKSDDMLDLLKDSIPKEYNILAPNGPFPLPKIRREYISKRYAWYFYDRHTDSYDINYDFPSTLIKKLVKSIGEEDSEKLIIGYSQGGYLSPFVANELTKVTKVIGLACTYKWQYLPEKLDYSLYAIHGDKDVMVDMENSKNHFDKVSPRAKKSAYIVIQDLGHELSDEFVREIAKLI